MRTCRALWTCAAFILLFAASAQAQPRSVQIRWDDTSRSLEIWVNCADDVCDGGEKIGGSGAYLFQVNEKDLVTLHMMATVEAGAAGDTRLDISYTIIGDDPTKAFQAALGKVFPSGAVDKTKKEATQVIEETLAVTDQLLPGGKLTTTFQRSVMKGEKSVPVSTKTLIFGIQDDYSWFVASFGIVASTAQDTRIDIVNTSKVISFVKDGAAKQAYEQKIVVRGTRDDVRPLQSVVSFLNFHLRGPAYASFGFRLDQQVFKEPLFGLMFMRKIGKVGLLFGGGIHLSEETEILADSGFSDGQTIDPTLGLTVGAIPSDDVYHVRYFFGFSAKYSETCHDAIDAPIADARGGVRRAHRHPDAGALGEPSRYDRRHRRCAWRGCRRGIRHRSGAPRNLRLQLERTGAPHRQARRVSAGVPQ